METDKIILCGNCSLNYHPVRTATKHRSERAESFKTFKNSGKPSLKNTSTPHPNNYMVKVKTKS